MFSPTRLLRAFVPAAVVLAAPAAAADSADMAKLKQHLTSVRTMSANFSQTDARGRVSRGTLKMKVPGKVRFAYAGDDLLLVADGKYLNFLDYTVGQKSRWPLSKTPLGVLLSGSPNLKGRAEIMPSDNAKVVVVRAKDPTQYGSLTIAFLRNGSAPGGLQMYGWTAIDAQNNRTVVKLSDVRYNIGVPDSSFSYAEPRKKGR